MYCTASSFGDLKTIVFDSPFNQSIYLIHLIQNLINESNGDPKKMWKTINRVLDKDVKSTNLSAIESEGKTLTKEHDILEALNRHFVSVGPNLAKQISSKSDDDCLKHIIPENREMLFKR